jgi:5-methylthioadenosine/S-adenosylhomocysteine deaminase
MDGRLETGLEVQLDDEGTISAIVPSSSNAEPYVLCAAFVNAHSHLEYRGLQGAIAASGYFDWIKAITLAKKRQSAAQVREDCLLAAAENRQTGVAYIAEHSDRPFAGEAMAVHGLGGVIFQEVITFAEHEAPAERLALATENMTKNSQYFDGEVHINPHAPWTVDEATLRAIAEAGGRVSIHVAESIHENDYLERNEGPIAVAAAEVGIRRQHGQRTVRYLESLGYLRGGVQFVHCCDIDQDEVLSLAAAGVSVAHCPRSNEALDCPRAPVREMLDAGVLVGLGLDSAASSGPIDMFAEMRAASAVAEKRGAPVTPEESWRMATTMGASSLGLAGWDIAEGASVALVRIDVTGAKSTSDLISLADPSKVSWVSTRVRN